MEINHFCIAADITTVEVTTGELTTTPKLTTTLDEITTVELIPNKVITTGSQS